VISTGLGLTVNYGSRQPAVAERSFGMLKWSLKPGASNVVDLSYPLKPGMTLMKPGYPDIEFENEFSPVVDETGYPPRGFFARLVRTHPNGFLEQYGTHTEASAHAFGTRGLFIDQYPVGQFVGPGVVFDITEKAMNNREYKVTVADVQEWKKKHGKIPDGAIVVIKSGQDRYWGDYTAYFGVDKDGKHHYPGISPDACQWLVDNCRINAVCTDCAMIDGQPEVKTPNYPEGKFPHGLAREITMQPPRNILNVEYMANTSKLPESGALIIIAPINWVGGCGGTVRALAILP